MFAYCKELSILLRRIKCHNLNLDIALRVSITVPEKLDIKHYVVLY